MDNRADYHCNLALPTVTIWLEKKVKIVSYFFAASACCCCCCCLFFPSVQELLPRSKLSRASSRAVLRSWGLHKTKQSTIKIKARLRKIQILQGQRSSLVTHRLSIPEDYISNPVWWKIFSSLSFVRLVQSNNLVTLFEQNVKNVRGVSGMKIFLFQCQWNNWW